MATSEDPNGIRGLLDKLRGPDVGASEQQADVVARCLSVYEGNRVVHDGVALPLDCACPAASECWAAPRLVRPPRSDAAVSVPWVGAQFHRTGLTVIGINMNAYGGLGAQWWKVRDAIGKLEAGRRVQFYFRAGAYCACVLDSLLGTRPNPGADPQAAANGWQGSALVEAIKCSPIGRASKPPNEMWENCPPRYLKHELELLKPRVILTMGIDAGNIARNLPGFDQTDEGDGFARGVATLAGTSVDVLRCRHPGRSERLWQASYASLRDSLERKPLPAPP